MSRYLEINGLQKIGEAIKGRLMPASMADYVIEIGEINGGTYYKGNSGKLELGIDYYVSSSSFNSNDVTNKLILIHKDTDTFLPFMTPCRCYGTAGVNGDTFSSLSYCRVSYSEDMGSNKPSTPGYYIDGYIGSTGGTKNFGMKIYCVAKGK